MLVIIFTGYEDKKYDEVAEVIRCHFTGTIRHHRAKARMIEPPMIYQDRTDLSVAHVIERIMKVHKDEDDVFTIHLSKKNVMDEYYNYIRQLRLQLKFYKANNHVGDEINVVHSHFNETDPYYKVWFESNDAGFWQLLNMFTQL